MLEIENCVVVIVDVQHKLARLMYEKENLFSNIQILIKAAKILDIPIIWCEQNPAGLGETVAEISQLLSADRPIAKFSFSCCGNEEFNRVLKNYGRKQILLCGIEAHVCIYQTAVELLGSGYSVHVMADAVSSRSSRNKQLAVERMCAEGIKADCVELALFELLRTAKHPKFKEVAALIK